APSPTSVAPSEAEATSISPATASSWSGVSDAKRLEAASCSGAGCTGGLNAAGDEDEVRTEPEREPEQDPPRDHRLRAGAAEHVQALEVRAGGGREEHDRECLAPPGLSDRGADERRPAADQAHQREERPARQLGVPGERRADPEALRRVVKREADHEHDREAQ